MAMSSGMPIPNPAKTLWKASDIAICERAKRKSPIPFQRDRFQVLINPKDDHDDHVPNPRNPTLIVLLLSQTGVLRPLHGPDDRALKRPRGMQSPSPLVSRSKKSRRTKTASPRL